MSTDPRHSPHSPSTDRWVVCPSRIAYTSMHPLASSRSETHTLCTQTRSTTPTPPHTSDTPCGQRSAHCRSHTRCTPQSLCSAPLRRCRRTSHTRCRRCSRSLRCRSSTPCCPSTSRTPGCTPGTATTPGSTPPGTRCTSHTRCRSHSHSPARTVYTSSALHPVPCQRDTPCTATTPTDPIPCPVPARHTTHKTCRSMSTDPRHSRCSH